MSESDARMDEQLFALPPSRVFLILMTLNVVGKNAELMYECMLHTRYLVAATNDIR